MVTDEDRAFLANATRVMQLIVGALAGGVLSFLVVALVVLPGPAGPPPDPPLLTYLSTAGALSALIIAAFIPVVITRNQRRAIIAGRAAAGPAGELGQLVAGYQTALIIRSAILEGAAFFCLVAYMLEQQTFTLFVAGVMLLRILAGFPTRSKVEEAVENESRTIEQLRQLN